MDEGAVGGCGFASSGPAGDASPQAVAASRRADRGGSASPLDGLAGDTSTRCHVRASRRVSIGAYWPRDANNTTAGRTTPSPPCLAGSNHRARHQARLQLDASPAHAWTLLARPGPPTPHPLLVAGKHSKRPPFPLWISLLRSLQFIWSSHPENSILSIFFRIPLPICLHLASISFHHPSILLLLLHLSLDLSVKSRCSTRPLPCLLLPAVLHLLLLKATLVFSLSLLRVQPRGSWKDLILLGFKKRPLLPSGTQSISWIGFALLFSFFCIRLSNIDRSQVVPLPFFALTVCLCFCFFPCSACCVSTFRHCLDEFSRLLPIQTPWSPGHPEFFEPFKDTPSLDGFIATAWRKPSAAAAV